MWELDYDKQANYWIKKDADSVKLKQENVDIRQHLEL